MTKLKKMDGSDFSWGGAYKTKDNPRRLAILVRDSR